MSVEFKDGLKAFRNQKRTEEQQENWNNFWDNLKKQNGEEENNKGK